MVTSNSIIGLLGLGLGIFALSKSIGSNRNSGLPEIPSLTQTNDDFNFAPTLPIRDQISQLVTKLTLQRSNLVQEEQEIRESKLFEGLRLDRSTADALYGLRVKTFSMLNFNQKEDFLKSQATENLQLQRIRL